MRLKRPSKSGGGAKEAGDREGVGWGGGFPHPDARGALAPLSLVLGTTAWKMCRVTLALSPALFARFPSAQITNEGASTGDPEDPW